MVTHLKRDPAWGCSLANFSFYASTEKKKLTEIIFISNLYFISGRRYWANIYSNMSPSQDTTDNNQVKEFFDSWSVQLSKNNVSGRATRKKKVAN